MGWLLSWWRHQMETFSALLAICAENSPVPAQRPVTRSFEVFSELRLNKRLSKQSWGWWFETLSCSLWRHRNVRNSGKIDRVITAPHCINITFWQSEHISRRTIYKGPGHSQWDDYLPLVRQQPLWSTFGTSQVLLNSGVYQFPDSCPLVIPDSKIHGANTGPIWGRQDPGGSHFDPMSLQGSNRVWKTWKTLKNIIFWKSRGKPWNFEKSSKVMEKSWNLENLTPINHPPALEIWHW